MDKKLLLIIILGSILVGAGIFVGVLNHEKVDLNSTVVQLTELKSTLNRDLEQRIIELELVRAEIIKLEDRNTKLQNINGELEESNKRLRTITDNLTAENRGLRNTASQLRFTNTELKQRIGNIKQITEGAGESAGTAEDLIDEIIEIFRRLKTEIEGE